MIAEGARVALDTCCFIYLFESNPHFLSQVRPIFDRVEAGDLVGLTSVLTRTEVLVAPLRAGNAPLARRYREAFRAFPHLEVHGIDADVADTAAELRARHSLRTPDALHVACALSAGADLYVTADARLARVGEIEICVLRPAGRA